MESLVQNPFTRLPREGALLLVWLLGSDHTFQRAWKRAFSLFNPIVYLINGFRWSFYGVSDVPVGLSFALTLVFFCACLAVVAWIFRTGYRLKT